MKFEFLPDVAIADIAFRAYGKTREELFENCGLALTTTMADLSKMGNEVKRKILIEGKDDAEILYNFLDELIYIKDVDGQLFNEFRCKLYTGKMAVECAGDTLKSIGRQNLLNDVKAITMHLFKIEKDANGLKAMVVVDI